MAPVVMRLIVPKQHAVSALQVLWVLCSLECAESFGYTHTIRVLLGLGWLVRLVALSSLGGFGSPKWPASFPFSSATHSGAISDFQFPKKITVPVGDTLRIRLPTNPSSGWG